MHQTLSKILRLKREGKINADQTLRAMTAALTGRSVSAQLPDAANSAFVTMHPRATARAEHEENALRAEAARVVREEDAAAAPDTLASLLRKMRDGELAEPHLFARWLDDLTSLAMLAYLGATAAKPRRRKSALPRQGNVTLATSLEDLPEDVLEDIVRDVIDDAFLTSVTMSEPTAANDDQAVDNVIDFFESVAALQGNNNPHHGR